MLDIPPAFLGLLKVLQRKNNLERKQERSLLALQGSVESIQPQQLGSNGSKSKTSASGKRSCFMTQKAAVTFEEGMLQLSKGAVQWKASSHTRPKSFHIVSCISAICLLHWKRCQRSLLKMNIQSAIQSWLTMTWAWAELKSVYHTVTNKQPFAGGKIVLSNGSAVDYDWLVLSMGSESSTLGIKGVKEFAVLFNTINDATQVKADVLTVCPVDNCKK